MTVVDPHLSKNSSSLDLIQNSPSIVLIEPQLGDNIGAAARAMLNCGLTDLRLVKPRDGWPNERAIATSSGATAVIDNVKVFSNTQEAVSDRNFVLATTARPRQMNKPVYDIKQTGKLLHEKTVDNKKTAILFGCERSGLSNDDIVLADGILTIPLNPSFTSLNLAQAVLLVSFEWLITSPSAIGNEKEKIAHETRPANKETLYNLFTHLESELDKNGFFKSPKMRPTITKNIRNMLGRATLSDQEVRTLHGIIVSLTQRKRKE